MEDGFKLLDDKMDATQMVMEDKFELMEERMIMSQKIVKAEFDGLATGISDEMKGINMKRFVLLTGFSASQEEFAVPVSRHYTTRCKF